MFKQIIFALVTSLFCLSANATLLTNNITTSYLDGLEVTVTTSGGTTYSSIFSDGSASVTDVFTLSIYNGDTEYGTFGDYDDLGDSDPTTGIWYGLWTLAADAYDIVSITISGEDSDIVFDDATRGFVDELDYTDADFAIAEFSDEISDLADYYSTLTITFTDYLVAGSSIDFVIDTDSIPEPPMIALLLIGLVGLALRKKKLVS